MNEPASSVEKMSHSVWIHSASRLLWDREIDRFVGFVARRCDNGDACNNFSDQSSLAAWPGPDQPIHGYLRSFYRQLNQRVASPPPL
nr:hypothetical protein CFP56_62140 [Quercus suber]